MQVDLLVPVSAANARASFLRALGPAAEERGFGAIWVPEHVVFFDDYESPYPYHDSQRLPMPGDVGVLEPFTVLTYLAAVTERIRLGTAICLVAQRSPVYTAKQAADLDVLSGGRVDLGVGIGWLREEFVALGVPWAKRGERADANLAMMRSLWTDAHTPAPDDPDCPPMRLYPKPAQAPLPVHVGGESAAAMARAAQHQGWFSFARTPDELPSVLADLDAHLGAAGRSRDADDFTLTVSPGPRTPSIDTVGAYVDAGVDRLVIAAGIVDDGATEAALDALVSFVEAARTAS